jgi:periplasmic protein CpxP/Spy
MKSFVALAFSAVLSLAASGVAMAQTDGPQPLTSRLESIHVPRSIDQELDHLTRDLDLTQNQRQQIRPLLQEHHDRIQALLDKNPGASRATLAPQIHAISDETHREIGMLLTDRQKQLAAAMLQRMHSGAETRGPNIGNP